MSRGIERGLKKIIEQDVSFNSFMLIGGNFVQFKVWKDFQDFCGNAR